MNRGTHLIENTRKKYLGMVTAVLLIVAIPGYALELKKSVMQIKKEDVKNAH